jgi:hypothetical protein
VSNPDALVVVIKGVNLGGGAKDYYFGTHGIHLGDRVAVPRIANDPEYTQSIGVRPWDRRASASVGAIELVNNDGGLDHWRGANVRNKVVEIWAGDSTERFDRFTRVATVMADTIEPNGEQTMSLQLVPNIARLDETMQTLFYASGIGNTTLVGQPVPVTLGRCFSVPAAPTNGNTHVYDVHDGAYAELLQAADNGDAFEPGDLSETTRGFDLVNKPNGQITADVLGEPDRNVFTLGPDVLFNVGDFKSWTNDNPNGWTTTETPNNIVTEASQRCEFFCSDQAIPCTITTGSRLIVGAEYQLDIATIINGTFGVRASVSIVATDGNNTQVLRADAPLSGSSLTLTFIADYPRLRISARTSGGFQSVIIDNLSIKAKRFSTALTTVGAICKHIIRDRFGLAVDANSFDAVDTSIGPHEVGRHISSVATGKAVLQPLLDSYWCYLYETTTGAIAMGRLDEPAPTSTLSINQAQLIDAVDIEDDFAPNLSTKLGAQRNWVQIGEASAAGSLDTTEKFTLAAGYRVTREATTPVHSFYGHGVNACVVGTDISDAESAAAEAERRAMLYGMKRSFYSIRAIVTNTALLTLMPGNTITLKAKRFDLASGKRLLVVAKSASFLRRSVDLVLWG